LILDTKETKKRLSFIVLDLVSLPISKITNGLNNKSLNNLNEIEKI